MAVEEPPVGASQAGISGLHVGDALGAARLFLGSGPQLGWEGRGAPQGYANFLIS